MNPSRNIPLSHQRMDKSQVAKYKKGEEPNDVLYWLSRSGYERLLMLEQIRQEYNLWKYSAQSGFQRVYRAVKRQRS